MPTPKPYSIDVVVPGLPLSEHAMSPGMTVCIEREKREREREREERERERERRERERERDFF